MSRMKEFYVLCRDIADSTERPIEDVYTEMIRHGAAANNAATIRSAKTLKKGFTGRTCKTMRKPLVSANLRFTKVAS